MSESRGPKDDARDAYSLAERLRTGAVTTTVYKGQGEFATLAGVRHDNLVRLDGLFQQQDTWFISMERM